MAEGAVRGDTHTASRQSRTTSDTGPFVMWVCLLMLALVDEGLLFANRATWATPTDALGIGTVFLLTYGVAGAVILSRHRSNPIGRIFLFLTAVMVVSASVTAWLPVGLLELAS